MEPIYPVLLKEYAGKYDDAGDCMIIKEIYFM